MKRILFLDDNYDRHLYFDELNKKPENEIHHIFLPYECMKRLTMYEFDEIHLDHDLGVDFNHIGSLSPIDSKRVVRFICEQKFKCPVIYIHSSNFEAALWMEEMLKYEHYNVIRKEFDFGDFYTRQNLAKEKQQEFLDSIKKMVEGL